MPRDGAGAYGLPSGNPVSNGTAIEDTWANDTLSDIATALSASLVADGQKAASANQPMGTFRHTNVGNASARTHYAATGQVQDASLIACGSVSGTNTITAGLSPAITAYAAGMIVTLTPAGNNTGATTLALNGLAALDVQKWDGDALASGDLVAGVPALLLLDSGGDDWILLNPQTVSAANVTPSTGTGNNVLSASPTLTGTVVVSALTASGAITATRDANETAEIAVDNDNNGTANAARITISSGDANSALFTAGSGRTSTVVSGGPTGAQVVLRGLGNYPLILGTNNTARFEIDGSGNYDFMAGTVTTNNATASEVGFKGIPQNIQAGNYTLLLTDAGKHLYHASGAGAGDTYTIPANASVAFPVGTAVSFVNQDSNAVSIAITGDTMTLAGTTTTGTRSLAQNGVATAVKTASTSWLISGTGLS